MMRQEGRFFFALLFVVLLSLSFITGESRVSEKINQGHAVIGTQQQFKTCDDCIKFCERKGHPRVLQCDIHGTWSVCTCADN